MHTNNTIISAARAEFLASLLKEALSVDAGGVPSIADSGSDVSVSISKNLLNQLGKPVRGKKMSGQEAGKKFELAVAQFLKSTFLQLGHLRPGKWDILSGEGKNALRISNFDQYHHLLKLAEMMKTDPELQVALGSEYFVEPDVVVTRQAEPEETINSTKPIVDDSVSRHAPLRASNYPDKVPQFLHASISCKWTIRSDRSQNARTEALNLIRNRNGHVPHIVAITAEPVPTRIASIARGTSDLDCVYHFALPELLKAVSATVEGRKSEQFRELEILIAGKRLRDISDLPLDLAI